MTKAKSEEALEIYVDGYMGIGSLEEEALNILFAERERKAYRQACKDVLEFAREKAFYMATNAMGESGMHVVELPDLETYVNGEEDE